MSNKVLLVFGVVLIVFGLSQYTSVDIPSPDNPVNVVETLEIDPPSDENLKELAQSVAESLKDGDDDRTKDGLRLASLYNDMSILIALDDNIIKNTNDIAQANVLSAKFLKINLKGKYPGLAESADTLFKTYVSENAVPLDSDMRTKAVDAFQALAWGCLQGAK
jgi:hypothetical protein